MPTRYVKIEYAKSPPWHRRVWVRWVLLLLVIVIVTPIALGLGKLASQRWQVHRLYQRCAAYQPAAATIIYDEDPSSFAALSKQPQYAVVRSLDRPAAYFVLPEWREFCADAKAGVIQSYGTLFVGELRTTTGKRRLVGVDITGWFRGAGSPVLSIHARAFSPTPALQIPPQTSSRTFNLTLAAHEGALCLFAGRVDPKAANHFTINYAVSASNGLIDGWLKDDGSILLEAR